jgi:hypothetical protein
MSKLMESALRKALDEATTLDRERLELLAVIRDAHVHLEVARKVGGLPGEAVARIEQANALLYRTLCTRAGQASGECGRCGQEWPLLLLSKCPEHGELLCPICEGCDDRAG